MSDLLLLTFILLCAGVLAVPIATRFGLGSVLGYLIAGIAIGPLLNYLHVDIVAIQHFAEFGVVIMLFLVGLEQEPKRLWQMRDKLLGLGGGQVLITTAIIAAICVTFSLDWRYAIAIGLVLSLSSTAIVIQTLTEKGLMKSDAGQSSLSVLLFQDIAVIPILAFMPLLASPELLEGLNQVAHDTHGADNHHTDGDHGSSFALTDHLNAWQSALLNIGVIAAVVLAGGPLIQGLLRFVSSARLQELFTATALLVVVAMSLLMTLIGLSPALGAFLAGVVLANSEYRHELESNISPFRSLLLGVFFITVGASVDFQLLAANWATIMGITLGLMVLKGLILLALGFMFKLKDLRCPCFRLGSLRQASLDLCCCP